MCRALLFHPWIANNGLVVAPYCWADEHSWVSKQSSDFEDIVLRSKLAVFDFHPIHIFLNSSDGNEYRKLKKETVGTPLNEVDTRILAEFRNLGFGTRNKLSEILNSDFACKGLDEI